MTDLPSALPTLNFFRFSTPSNPQTPLPAAPQMLLTPEKSIQLQNEIGADIIMALDDVVSSTTTGP